MSRFHLNLNGEPGKCRASKGNCPFGGDDSHYRTIQDARKAFEISMENDSRLKEPSEPPPPKVDSPDTWPLNESSEAFKRTLDERFSGEFGSQKLSVKTRMVTWDGESLSWQADVFSPAGDKVGYLRRMVAPGLYANNEWLALDAGYRGDGFANAFTKEYDKWLQSLAVKEVRCYAASNPVPEENARLTGAFHWARSFSWDGKPSKVIELLKSCLEEDFTSEEKSSIESVLRRFSETQESAWPTPSELAYLEPDELGKRLLNRKVAWYGKRAVGVTVNVHERS